MNIDDKIKCALVGCSVGLVVLVILMFMASAFYTWQNPPEVNVYLTGVGMGALSAFTLIVGYYFGSSKGSQIKDDTIAKLANGNGAP